MHQRSRQQCTARIMDRIAEAALNEDHMAPYRRLFYALVFVYAIAAGVSILSYFRYACRFGSFEECRDAHPRCGSNDLSGRADCERYAGVHEDCLCSACGACMTAGEKRHCRTPRSERIRLCHAFFDRLDLDQEQEQEP